MRKSFLITALAFVCGTLFSFFAKGQSRPSGTVRLVVPTPPGSSVDVVARVIGEKLKASW